MADLNFPKDRTELVPPGTGSLQTGDTYTANGTTWVYDATVGAWGSGTGATTDTIYLSRVNDDTAEGAITFTGETAHNGGLSSTTGEFSGLTTHEAGVSVTGGNETTVDTGIYGANNQVRFACNGLNPLRVQSENNIVNVLGRNQSTTGTSRLVFGNYLGTDFTSITDVYGFYTKLESAVDVTSTCDNFYGNYVEFGTNGIGFATNSYGFYSALTTSSASGSAHNFYAAGNAPNYFAGEALTTGYIKNRSGFLCQRKTDGSLANDDFSDQVINPRQSKKHGTSIRNEGQILTFLNTSTDGWQVGRQNDGQLLGFYNNANNLVGQFGISGGALISPGGSDYRLKTNIVDLPSATTVIKQLRPVNFELIGFEGYVHDGFIAHELQEQVPVAVTGTKDEEEAIGTLTDAAGVVTTDVTEPETLPYGETWVQTGTRPVYQGVDQTKLIPLLTKALQEALDKIETLETRLSDAGIA